MPRPCYCHEPRCRLCWLADHDPRYQRLWGLLAPIVPIPPCQHLGPPTGEERACGTCPGSVRLKVLSCAVHGGCTPYKELTGLACCVTCCSDTRLLQGVVKPLRVTRLPLESLTTGQLFNPSIIEYQGRLLCCYRSGWSGSRLWLAELNSAYQALHAQRLELRHPLCNGGQEDPRLFLHGGRLHLQFQGVIVKDGVTTVQVLYALLREDGSAEYVWHPEVPGASTWEKNWQPFSHEGELYAVYRMQPHKVVHFVGGNAYPFSEQMTTLPWSVGEVRGGAPPVRVGEEYWCWFHGTDRTRKPALYTMGVATFAAKPPFQWLRCTPMPVMVPDVRDCPKGWWANVVFPGGTILKDGKWLVSYGYHDHECRMVEFSHQSIEDKLRMLS